MTSHPTASVASNHSGRSTIAIVSTWPETRNAEYEVTERLIAAGRNIGCDTLTIDNDGYVLASSRVDDLLLGQRIEKGDCEFVISLHFQSPRLYDAYSYITLWNPPEFFQAFGYERSVAALASHSNVLSCHSDVSDRHALNVYAGLGRPLKEPLPTLFHSLPKPYLEPNIHGGSKLFYIGINWERINGTRGRHHDLLTTLDEDDLIDIYGPEEFYGIKPWDGFKTYRGEIPFDGRSILDRLNESGICLAFSSASHQRSGIMSNRLFEGLAAGTVIVANPHPFIEKYFSDCVHVVDDRLPPAELCRAVRDIVEEVRANPEAARERALVGQRRLSETFSLDGSLSALLASRRGGDPTSRSGQDRLGSVDVLVLFPGGDLDLLAGMLANVTRQTGVALTVTVLWPRSFAPTGAEQDRIESMLGEVRRTPGVQSVVLHPFVDGRDGALAVSRTRGEAVFETLGRCGCDFVSLMECDEYWFSDHLASLVRSLQRAPDAEAAVSGLIVEDIVEASKARRRLDTIGFAGHVDAISATYSGQAGRFLYRASLARDLPPHLLPLLDGCEPRALLLRSLLDAELALTNEASFVTLRDREEQRVIRRTPELEQTAVILDSVRGDPRWDKRRRELGQSRGLMARQLALNFIYKTSLGANGSGFLQSGFSAPEAEYAWIDGKSGTLDFMMPAGKPAELALTVAGREPGQSCSVLANGEEIITEAPVGSGPVELRAPLPVIGGVGLGQMTIVIRAAVSAQVRNKEGKVVDPRYLGLNLHRFAVFDAQPPLLAIGRSCGFGGDDEVVGLLRSGFASPERGFVWMDGTSGTLAFKVDSGAPGLEFRMAVQGRKSAQGQDQRCAIQVNGQSRLSNISVSETVMELRLPLSDEDLGAGKAVNVEITLDHADPVVDEGGRVVDTRRLGLCLHSVGVFPVDQRPERIRDRLRREISARTRVLRR